MNAQSDLENIQAIHDLMVSQVRLLWDKAVRRYKLQRNTRIKLIATTEAGMNRGFRCGDCGPAIIKAPPHGRILAILRVPIERIPTGLDAIIDDAIPHGLAHIVCQLRPDIGHGYQHDAGLDEVYNWIKENA